MPDTGSPAPGAGFNEMVGLSGGEGADRAATVTLTVGEAHLNRRGRSTAAPSPH